jgi:triacylglycerol esterase/lipase EstA (alpha/beta hydrolase family)
MVFGGICSGLAGLKILNRVADRFSGLLPALIHWIHAMVFEAFAIISMLCLRPIGYLWKLQSKGGSRQPILLVHGYIHDSSAWIYIRWQLVRHGFAPIYLLNLNPPFLSINDYVKQVEARVLQIAKETGRQDLILIGHSMGGIVSSLYALRVALPGTVTDVITIASPLAGTHVARIAIGRDAREMERNSDFLKSLPKEIRKSKKIRFYQIATKTDQLVIPYTSEIVNESSERRFVLNDIGHATLLYSPRVLRKILSWLKGVSNNKF